MANLIPAATSVAAERPMATFPVGWTLAKRSTANAATDARPGSRNPLVFSAISPRDGRGRSQTAIEMNRIAVGQAIELNVVPTRLDPAEELKTLKVSPTTFNAIPDASSAQGALPRPERRAVAATMRAS